MKLILILTTALILFSCANSGLVSYNGKNKVPKHKEEISDLSYVTLSELLINSSGDRGDGVVKVEKEQILSRCENRYQELLEYYSDGKLESSRLIFDHIIDNLEYLYPDERLSDSILIRDFVKNIYNPKLKNSEQIFKIYNSLYNIKESSELVIETKGKSSNFSSSESSTFLKYQVETIFGDKRLDNEEFLREVKVHYLEIIDDLFSLKETYLRYKRYDSFLSSKFSKENLPSYYKFIPSVLSAFYNNKKSGGIWKLERSGNLGMRDDIGASTAAFITRVKKVKSRDDFGVISTILEDGGTRFKNGVKSFDLNSSTFAEFVAYSVLFSNPEKIGVEATNIGDDNKKWEKSYTAYNKNPSKFKKSAKKSRVKSKGKSYKKGTSYLSMKYRIRKGDSLAKIAKLYKTDVASLKRWNPRTTSKKYLPVGGTLYLRGYEFTRYKARNGDYMGKICKKFGMKQSEFKKINNLRSNKILKGKKYYVYK